MAALRVFAFINCDLYCILQTMQAALHAGGVWVALQLLCAEQYSVWDLRGVSRGCIKSDLCCVVMLTAVVQVAYNLAEDVQAAYCCLATLAISNSL